MRFIIKVHFVSAGFNFDKDTKLRESGNLRVGKEIFLIYVKIESKTPI